MSSRSASSPPLNGAIAAEPLPEPILHALAQALKQLRFGTVEIIVQDGKVIQINKTEKIRF